MSPARRVRLAFACVFCAVVVSPSLAQASTITANTKSDTSTDSQCSLRQALSTAEEGTNEGGCTIVQSSGPTTGPGPSRSEARSTEPLTVL